jgi:hypothetical protein
MADDTIRLSLDTSGAVASAKELASSADMLDAAFAEVFRSATHLGTAAADMGHAVDAASTATTAAAKATAQAATDVYELADAYEVLGEKIESPLTSAAKVPRAFDWSTINTGARESERQIVRFGEAVIDVGNKTDASGKKIAGAMKGNSLAVLNFSRGIQDFAQGGIGGVLNNIEGMLLPLGAKIAAFAGPVTLVATAGYLLYNNWNRVLGVFRDTQPVEKLGDTMGRLEAAMDQAKDRMAELRKEGSLTNEQVQEYNRLSEHQIELEKEKTREQERQQAVKKLNESKAPAEEEADKNRSKALQDAWLPIKDDLIAGLAAALRSQAWGQYHNAINRANAAPHGSEEQQGWLDAARRLRPLAQDTPWSFEQHAGHAQNLLASAMFQGNAGAFQQIMGLFRGNQGAFAPGAAAVLQKPLPQTEKDKQAREQMIREANETYSARRSEAGIKEEEDAIEDFEGFMKKTEQEKAEAEVEMARERLKEWEQTAQKHGDQAVLSAMDTVHAADRKKNPFDADLPGRQRTERDLMEVQLWQNRQDIEDEDRQRRHPGVARQWAPIPTNGLRGAALARAQAENSRRAREAQTRQVEQARDAAFADPHAMIPLNGLRGAALNRAKAENAKRRRDALAKQKRDARVRQQPANIQGAPKAAGNGAIAGNIAIAQQTLNLTGQIVNSMGQMGNQQQQMKAELRRQQQQLDAARRTALKR